MDPTSVLSRLGPRGGGLRVVSSPRGWLVADEDLVEALLQAGLGPDDEPRLEASELVGKRPLERLDVGGVPLVVRRYHHGGLLRWLTGERFASPQRPFLELCLQRELVARGFRSPEVVAARAARATAWGWRLAVVTRRVPEALDLGQALTLQCTGGLAPSRWRSLVGEVGRLVADLHAAGFLHADLTPRNLLVERASLERGTPRLWVLDLDRSRWLEAIPELDRRRNVARLARHLGRLEREHGLSLRRTDVARFLTAWRPERVSRHAAWRAMAEQGRRGRGPHRVGWWLERLLGRGRTGAEGHLRGSLEGPGRGRRDPGGPTA